MTDTIEAAKMYVDIVIRSSGDGWLPLLDDPFVFDENLGVRFLAASTKGEHLTWGILGSALQGLQECVIYNGWYQLAEIQIFDAPWGHVGNGKLIWA